MSTPLARFARHAPLLSLLVVGACSETTYAPRPSWPSPPANDLGAPAERTDPRGQHHESEGPERGSRPSVPLTTQQREIQVYEGKTAPWPAVVVGVIDVHVDATRSSEAFDELRRQASALGAQAVIGADFHHGEGREPSHVSGMAIRYRDAPDRAYEVLGRIDIAVSSSDSAAEAGALDALRKRGTELGADRVIDVEFHHDDQGGPSHLTGLAVRYRK